MDQISVARKAALFNANALSIRPPRIHISAPCELMTDTTLAAMSADGRRLAIKSTITDERTIWFAVSHEMRHAWQIKHSTDFSSYKTANESGKLEYNSQEAEIDAHAWACIVINNVFKLQPMLDSLGKELADMVANRSEEIILNRIW